MSSPFSSSSAFFSPGHSTVKVYSDRVISTMQTPPRSFPSHGHSAEDPSRSLFETLYFPSSQAGYAQLVARVSSLEEEISSLRTDLVIVKGKLEAQEAEK